MVSALQTAQAFAIAAVCWIGLVVVACAEGGSEGNVSSRIIEPKSPGTISFEAGNQLGPKAALEIKVKPVAVKQGDDLLLTIDLVETESLKSAAATPAKLASGTVAFFPPARVGDERTFVVPLDKGGRSAAKAVPLTAVVSVVAANPERNIADVRLELVGARLR